VMPRDVGRVEFEKDALSLRSSIAGFGAIRSVDNKKKALHCPVIVCRAKSKNMRTTLR